MEFNFDLILVCQMGILILTGFLQSEVLSFVLQVRDINEDFGQKNIFFLDWSKFGLANFFLFFICKITQDVIFVLRQTMKNNVASVLTTRLLIQLRRLIPDRSPKNEFTAYAKLAECLCGIKSEVKFYKTHVDLTVYHNQVH